MTIMERDRALKNIADNSKCAVIIVSILAGGVGKPVLYTFNYTWFFFKPIFPYKGLI